MLAYFLIISQNTLNSLVCWYRSRTKSFRTKVSSRWEKRRSRKKGRGDPAGVIHAHHDAEFWALSASQIKALQFVPGVRITETTFEWLHYKTFLKRCNQRDHWLWIYLSSLFRLAEGCKSAFPMVWWHEVFQWVASTKAPGTVTGVTILLTASVSRNLGLQIAVCVCVCGTWSLGQDALVLSKGTRGRSESG